MDDDTVTVQPDLIEQTSTFATPVVQHPQQDQHQLEHHRKPPAPRPLAHFLPDRRDLRDVEKRRWRGSRLPDAGDQRARLLRALSHLYKDYLRICLALAQQPPQTNGIEESREFDSLSLLYQGDEDPDADCEGRTERRCVVVQRRRQPQHQHQDGSVGSKIAGFGAPINQVLLRRAGGAEVWIDAPLALEIRLPRVQEMLGEVMSACPFVTDRMEALGELRAAGYSASDCVEYLKEVKGLRESATAAAGMPAASLQQPPKPQQRWSNSPSRDIRSRLASGLANLRATLTNFSVDVVALAFRVEASVSAVSAQAAVLGRSCRRLRQDVRTARARRLQREAAELRARFWNEERQRRSAFNDLQEQLGSVRVFAKCRRGVGEQAVFPCGPDCLRVTTDGHGRVAETFYFDGVFVTGSGWTQQQRKRLLASNSIGDEAGDLLDEDSSSDALLFEELRPLIASFMDGYNVCFIAYGGEASGKTHTLHGSGGDLQSGLVYRSLAAALAEVRDRSTVWELELAAGCIEVYNDALLDIGDRERGPRRLPASCLDSGLSTLFDSLCQLEVTDEADALAAIRLASGRRRVARTALNPQSSRSHLLQLLRVRGRSHAHGERVCAFLGLMDLAGAENVVKAATLNDPRRSAEAGHINRSLASFNRLFINLRRCTGARGVASYRDSKLTQLMKPFVTDHGKCCIIVTVRTDRHSLSASLSSLRFGRDARQVMLGRAKRQLL